MRNDRNCGQPAEKEEGGGQEGGDARRGNRAPVATGALRFNGRRHSAASLACFRNLVATCKSASGSSEKNSCRREASAAAVMEAPSNANESEGSLSLALPAPRNLPSRHRVAAAAAAASRKQFLTHGHGGPRLNHFSVLFV
jgi:hypothetical protein